MPSIAERLVGRHAPACPLQSTSGEFVDLSTTPGRVVVFVHPGIRSPDRDLPADWWSTPGLEGCTAQSCSFRDRHGDIAATGAPVFGLSGNSPEDQRAARERLHLPFHLLSDDGLCFVRLLGLPAQRINGDVVASRLSLILNDGLVEHARFPIENPADDAEEVLRWLIEKAPT